MGRGGRALLPAVPVERRPPDCRPLRGVSVARGNIGAGRPRRADRLVPRSARALPAPPAPPAGRLRPVRSRGWTPAVAAARVHAPLATGPLTHRRVPVADLVARGQARRLEQIEGQARAWVEDCAHGGRRRPLTSSDASGLRRLFGRGRAGRPGADRRARGSRRCARELLGDWDRLLARKVRRLAVLARRARAGAVLGEDEAAEIAESWGLSYATGIDPPGATFDGPACAAVEQDPHDALADARADGRRRRADWEVRARPARQRRDRPPRRRRGRRRRDRATCASATAMPAAPPTPRRRSRADYRVGNGTAGQRGRRGDRAHRAVRRPTRRVITGVRNPLPACGGIDPEPVAAGAAAAPRCAIRSRLQRAVTADDYATLAGRRCRGVQRAAAHAVVDGQLVRGRRRARPAGHGRRCPPGSPARSRARSSATAGSATTCASGAAEIRADRPGAASSACEPRAERGRVAARVLEVLGSGVSRPASAASSTPTS